MKKLHDFNEIFDGQIVFRTLLTGMSNPGRILSIAKQAEKLYGNYPAFLALAITLLDNEVTFCTCGNPELREDISLLTLSKETDMEEADFLFVDKAELLPEVFARAKCGTLADPQKSATIFIRTEIEGDHTLNLYGAGIDREVELTVSDIVEATVNQRDSQAYEYPQGVDLIFVSDDSEILCIPRLVLQKEER